ncbi:MAG: RDD family protein, partial [Eubacteriales bacterium]|nr:RDD family protein [Eubacteriales bacterium]
SESDIREITSDYGDIFDHNAADGKTEEEVAKEIGSPAKIARTILEDGMETSKIFDKVLEPDQNVAVEKLAPMSRRLGAYIIDSLLLGVVVIGGMFALFAPFLYMVRTSSAEIHTVTTNLGHMGNQMVTMGGPASRFAFANIIILVMLFGAFNLFTTIFIWVTNGYTPGKWILSMRVVKINGGKISFLDAFLRELIIKCIANSLLSGFLNLGSFIWGCVTDDHKTVHDLVAQTRVVEWDRSRKKSVNASNPLES